MELDKYFMGMFASNNELDLKIILQKHNFENAIIVSNRLKSIYLTIEKNLEGLGIKCKRGPGLGCIMEDFDENSDLVVALYRTEEKEYLQELDRKIDFGLASHIIEKEKKLDVPKVDNLLIIPSLPELSGEMNGKKDEIYALRASYAVATLIMYSYEIHNPEQGKKLIEKFERFKEENMNLINLVF